jgi:hypothetical protein
MTRRRYSVAMTAQIAGDLQRHLIREDGQEDVCLIGYSTSTGSRRTSALLQRVVIPLPDERDVHGNASFSGDYVLRAATEAASEGCGIGIVHSHPLGVGWQGMSGWDYDAESSFAFLANELTGRPLLGMTLAGNDLGWSARVWTPTKEPLLCESVRVVGSHLDVTWNEELRAAPTIEASQLRTTSVWGPSIQRDLARLRVLVVGLGSVGLEVAVRLAATGMTNLGLMDFDIVELANLDRLIGATATDAYLRRRKVDLAQELVMRAATAPDMQVDILDMSICEPEGLKHALDYDLIFSCVDRPWPRAVLNMVAYADLIPVVDGGIGLDAFPEGGMRSGTWRSHVIRPGRPCLACNGQLSLGQVQAEKDGSLDDPSYIAGLRDDESTGRENVGVLSVSVVSSLLAQFVSHAVAPGGEGDPGPLQYWLTTHTLEHRPDRSSPHCYFEQSTAIGDDRFNLTGHHEAAAAAKALRVSDDPSRAGVRKRFEDLEEEERELNKVSLEGLQE